ncbi:MAG: ABC transporter ATP-binding protein, partial [Spirochaetia bacterium]
MAVAFPFLFFLGQLAVVLVSWFGGTAVIENLLDPAAGGLSMGQLVAFNEYALMAMWPIIALGMTLQFLTAASASAVRIQQLLDEQPDIADAESARVMESFRGEITFRDVSFAYGGGENAVDGVSLTVRAGEKLGVLGRTGGGKSSLAALIPRYYDVTSGAVLIDGIDVREIAVGSLQSRVSVVLQETVLMAGSILDNVTYAYRPGAATPDAASTPGAAAVPAAAVLRAAEIACAREFIEEKEGGWSEPVGERGVGLSGGQRQRIAIA